MCGFAGFFDWSARSSAAEMEAIASRMAARLQHRGPDDAGAWADADAGAAFGFRRLSIIDLSPPGHQPMTTPAAATCSLQRRDLQPPGAPRGARARGPVAFRGHSDTEVLLAAFARMGRRRAAATESACSRSRSGTARARASPRPRPLRQKPLYYGRMGDTLLFGSELKALQAHPALRGEIDRDVLTLLLRFNYIPGPFSIFKNIRKLPPGSLITIERSAELPAPVEYWSAHHTVTAGVANRFAGSEAEAGERLEALLRKAIRDEMLADVPVGALLSGGIDSSTIVALMQAESARPVKTFTIGFSNDYFNEAASPKRLPGI